VQSLYRVESYRLARPSVRPSVRPFVRLSHTGVTRKQNKRRKIKIGTKVPDGTRKWSANFQLKRSKVKVTGCQKRQEIAGWFAVAAGRKLSCTHAMICR